MRISKKLVFHVGKWALGIGFIFLILIIRADLYGYRSMVAKIFPFNIIVKQRRTIEQGAADFHINHTKPSFTALADFIENDRAELSETAIRGYVLYYRNILERFPKDDQPRAVLGFLYFMKKDLVRAEKYFKQAIDLAPDVFWHYYNLGIVYYEMGDFKSATMVFEQAQKIDVQKTLNQISQSIILRQIVASFEEKQYNLIQAIEKGYQQTNVFLSHLQDNKRLGRVDKDLLKPRIF